MTTMPVGSIVHLTSCIIKAKISAETTMPDTPDMYGAELEIMDDRGALNVSGLAGQQGSDGQVTFAFRQQTDITVKTLRDLPTGYGSADTGKYYVIKQDVVGRWNASTNIPHLADGTGENGDAYRVSVPGTANFGHGAISFLENEYVVYNGSRWEQRGTHNVQWAWVWWGSEWRKVFMGSEGPAGPIPRIQPSAELISPSLDSFVDTSGTTLVPSWRFNLAVKPGDSGPPSRLRDMPDYYGPNPGEHMVLMCSDTFNQQGYAIWEPANVQALSPRAYSISESGFSNHYPPLPNAFINMAADERVSIAEFQLPAQPFDWTPVVWGHIAGTNQIDTGRTYQPTDIPADILYNPAKLVEFLSAFLGEGFNQLADFVGRAVLAPEAGLLDLAMRIGCRVLLGGSQQVSRGFGNGRGEVNLMPHYSTRGRPTRNITPTNNYAVIKANPTAAAIDNAEALLAKDQNRAPVFQANAATKLKVELHNDGFAGMYNFSAVNSQVLILVVPIDAYASYATTPLTRRVQ